MPKIAHFPGSRRKARASYAWVFYMGRVRRLSPSLLPAIARGEARLLALPKAWRKPKLAPDRHQLALESHRRGRKPGETAEPIKSWRAVAEVLGVTSHTVARYRKARGDTRKPWFPSADAVRDWYAMLLAGPAPKKPGRRPARRTEVADAEYTLANLIAGKLR